jgi:hypothetical protein
MLALLFMTVVASATVTIPTEFKEVVADAGLIVRGHVTDVRAVSTRSLGIETLATVGVEAVLKGEAADFVIMRVPGGVIGRVRSVMVGHRPSSVNRACSFSSGTRR